ncbi:hypothetical protein ACFQL1_22540 [Halomicroarcula sp. GCM10025709]|uniref:hypothetical protein n=1 Tax=Haloarcula TaxID=2237 RepID=UPI0024C271BF|nr:hypothetical protein [Halomicroarcula sp. YJ-61-S]
MDRRSFLRSGSALIGGTALSALAGCSGGSSSPPPRRAQVFEGVSLSGTQLQIQFVSNPRVESRVETVDGSLALGQLSPVGVASAQKGARGATRGSGAYSNAPRGRHGWAVWHGGDYDDWREEHDDELRMYPAAISAAGVAYLGSDQRYENDPPDAGPVPWDTQWSSAQNGASHTVALSEAAPSSSPQEGWYRVGTKLVGEESNADFGWQGADFEIDNNGSWQIDKSWHVRPRV